MGPSILDLAPTALRHYRTSLLRSICTESFVDFFAHAFAVANPGTPLQLGHHIAAMCQHIQWQLEDRDRAMREPSFVMRAQNLLINVPPRSLKTTVLVFATAWCWIRWPSTKILYLSANPRVSLDGARSARTLLQSEWFVETFRPGWSLREDQESLGSLGNTAGGTRAARGLSSVVTGEGADWLCIDDPHDMRDTEHEMSMTILGYDAAVANRLNDPRTSIRTAIMQRFRERDFSGHVLGTSP
jgi:hypothetical protein